MKKLNKILPDKKIEEIYNSFCDWYEDNRLTEEAIKDKLKQVINSIFLPELEKRDKEIERLKGQIKLGSALMKAESNQKIQSLESEVEMLTDRLESRTDDTLDLKITKKRNESLEAKVKEYEKHNQILLKAL